ncbi:hypothetical protein AX17_002500 [Amanita inopinata Kibby_2008]|nr:hypothetical protein AX17_002500 [Amanita inopinata Kibby_2008]
MSNYPGLRVPFQPLALPGALLPTTWWNPGNFFTWADRFTLYKQYGTDTITIVSFMANAPSIYTSNLEVIRQIAPNGPRASFIKPIIGSKALLMWGMNLFSANGETWRRHRRITGPAFNHTLYNHVFQESVTTYHEIVDSDQWKGKDEVEVPVLQKLTYKYTLLVLAKCGFGLPSSWSTPPEAVDGSMSVQEAMHIVAGSSMVAVFAPWLMRLPFAKFRRMRTAYEQLMLFMRTQVAERKAVVQRDKEEGLGEVGKDIFTMLVQANEDETAKYKLDNQELIGNIYTMLFAGHETTATSLAATMSFMALYQDIQDEVFEQIRSIVGYDRDPSFDDYAKLDKVLAVFLEGIRMFPPAHLMIRQAAEDTVLKIQNPVGQDGFTMLSIPKGTIVTADMIGLQYNPRYYDEPEKYRPSRWYGVANESEAFTAFSVGTRACIGRKFATSQAVALLTMLIRDWHIEPLLRTGESKEEWANRVLEAKVVLALGINDIPIKFTRRRQST